MRDVDKKTEHLFGIPLFTWESWDDAGEDDLMFFDIKWCFPSMQKFDGGDLYLCSDGQCRGMFSLNNADGDIVEEWKDKYFTDIPEFADELRKKLS